MKSLLALLLALSSVAAALAADFDKSHALFAGVLKNVVKDGRVDYALLKKNRAPLDAYVAALAAVHPHALASWSREERFAFWLNAYNALTLKAVIDNYPIKGSIFSLYPRNSIRQISGIWDKTRFGVASRSVTLDEIEHEVLRKEFADPRLHVAINCASASCPEHRSEPFQGDRLNSQLTEACQAFASSPSRNKVDLQSKTIDSSEIFGWFKDDFLKVYAPTGKFADQTGKAAAAASFLTTFAQPSTADAVKAGGFTVRYLKYDWSLNDVKDSGRSSASREETPARTLPAPPSR